MAKIILPMPLTRIIVKVSEAIGKLTNKDPLITELMLYNLVRNNAYDSSKAKRELGYQTRPFADTIYDEVEWEAAGGHHHRTGDRASGDRPGLGRCGYAARPGGHRRQHLRLHLCADCGRCG